MDALLLGLSLGLGAGLAPGPLLALVVGATLERGFAAGARLAAAPLVTDAPIVAVCVLVLRSLPEGALAALSLGGAAFVAWLAVDALRGSEGAASTAGTRFTLRRAAVANVLSPHPWLFWVTVGGPLLVADGVGPGVTFLVAFYALLVGSKVAVAGLVESGRRRGASRLVPRAVAARLGTSSVVARFGAARLVAAVLLAAAAAALLADGLSRLG